MRDLRDTNGPAAGQADTEDALRRLAALREAVDLINVGVGPAGGTPPLGRTRGAMTAAKGAPRFAAFGR